MKLLIICSYFPPDTSIASIRPYMLAKYLNLHGHEVTVLYLGKNHRQPDDFLPKLKNVKICTALLDSVDKSKPEIVLPEKDEQGEVNKPRFGFIPNKIRKILKICYYSIIDPNDTIKRIKKAQNQYLQQRNAIDILAENKYDVVFSTYSNLENIFAGRYAAEKYRALWIQDFRDPVTEYNRKGSWFWNIIARRIQMYAINKADLVTSVSCGLTETLKKMNNKARIITVHNGYDPIEEPVEKKKDNEKVLTFCYTGQMYETRYAALDSLLSVLVQLIKQQKIEQKKIRFIYAGPESNGIRECFRKKGIEDILLDYGYVSRDEVTKIQAYSDIYLVLSWNTRSNQGILTGKLYEGIRAHKPILSVVTGEIPNSELYQLNEKYHYGYCYESCRENEMGKSFEEYILNCYKQIQTSNHIAYQASDEWERDFSYDYIAKQLEDEIAKLMGNGC